MGNRHSDVRLYWIELLLFLDAGTGPALQRTQPARHGRMPSHCTGLDTFKPYIEYLKGGDGWSLELSSDLHLTVGDMPSLSGLGRLVGCSRQCDIAGAPTVSELRAYTVGIASRPVVGQPAHIDGKLIRAICDGRLLHDESE